MVAQRKFKIVPSNNSLTIITFSSCLTKDTETKGKGGGHRKQKEL